MALSILSAVGFGTSSAQAISSETSHAASPPPEPTGQVQAPKLTPQQLIRGLEAVESSNIARDRVDIDGAVYYRYSVGENSLTLPAAQNFSGDLPVQYVGYGDSVRDASTYFDVRFSGIKMAIGFNTVDQQALASGGAAVVTAAICAIPAVGWVACASIGVVVGVATTYVLANGICSRERILWWYDVSGGSTVECRKSAPKL